MKNKTKIISIVCIIILITVLIIGASFLVTKYNAKQKEEKEIQEALEKEKQTIVDDFEIFKEKVSAFTSQQTIVLEKINSISYLTDISDKYDDLVNEYKKFESLLTDLDNSSQELKEKYKNNNYNDENITNKLNAFMIAYEQVFYNYIQAVESFNNKVKEYNEWVENAQVTTEYKKINELDSLYKDYVDLNGDGIYNGVANS